MTTAIQLYGKMLAFSRLKINTSDFGAIRAALDELKTAQKTTPVVIESDEVLDLTALSELLWEYNIAVIGVIDGVLNDSAKSLRLAIFPNDGSRMERLSYDTPTQKDGTAVSATGHTSEIPTPTTTAQTAQTGAGIHSLVYEQMLRSGQTVHHFGGDLIITGSVNTGAEAITDGNLHIYGTAGGRLIAGATGDKDARIFCQKFDPKLVSVAGTYCLRDDIPDEFIGKAVQVSYDGEKGLIFSLMKG